MAPGNNERHSNHSGHTGTIPKTKARNNCNVPQEAVTPTRRDMTTNLVSTSLDWVPVSEYNTRSNYNQSRKPTNNTSDHELTDLDNPVSYESGFGRFVPVRPQPRALPLNVQNQNVASDLQDDGGSTSSGHMLHPYAHQIQNGLNPHNNHTAAAVMIVNPTTPNAVSESINQPFNAPHQNRNNLTRNLNPARNNLEGNSHMSNSNTTPATSNTRSGTKSVNLMNNMYDQGQGSFNNVNENHVQMHRESARTLGEAIVAACPDAAAVERRLGQIREYIRVTSTLVDTMRNSEDEEVVVRPVSAQSNGSAYSENELWQNEIKNKMEMSQLRLASLKQKQKRLLKYQEEAKQQFDEMTRERQSQEMHNPSTSHDNFGGMQSQSHGSNYHHSNRMYAANQIGVATTLPHSLDSVHSQQNLTSNMENNHAHSSRSIHSQDEQFSHRETNVVSSEDVTGGGRDSDAEEEEGLLNERARLLQMKLRELQLKKQHMESLVSEFQKLQMATRGTSSQNTYSSSGEESGVEDSTCKFAANKQGGNMKNDDPFKLIEIKAIKTALQKTKDLMRSVENYESEHLASNHNDSYQMSCHSNLHDNKSEGGGSMGDWSNEGSVCRVRNSLQRHKFTNNQHSQQHQQQQHQIPQQQSHEDNIATLQELSQELRIETEKIMGERARIKDMMSNKELARKQKKLNSEVVPGPSGAPGPAERRQMQLRALLADKQRELEALINKEKTMRPGAVNEKGDSRAASVVNQSYTSEQEDPESRSQQNTMGSQNSRENESFRGDADSALRARVMNSVPSHIGSAYGSDSDSAARGKSNQRNRMRRRQVQDRLSEECISQENNPSQNIRFDSRAEQSNINMVPPISQNDNPASTTSYPQMTPPCWNPNKSNQDMRNQFTQNSHSQTMERLLGTPQMSFSPSLPFNMMMPYGVMGGCGCGCAMWGPWCWQQLALQQREIHQLREQVNHLEERWRAESASHTLNNQVPPGNRANNYWDNFRSYSRQNLLSANSKTNADGHLGAAAHSPQPLAERSHNALRLPPAPTAPPPAPKRNTNHPSTHPPPPHNDDVTRRSNVSYDRSLSFSSAPDVLNVNQTTDSDAPSQRNFEDPSFNVPDVNLNRQESSRVLSGRNLNIANPIPELIQSHSNLNTSAICKKKSSSKLPAKNRRNLDYSQTSNINIASASEEPNPNLASTSRDVQDKATSKLFDLLRENVYSEVTTLIGVNESHPDFLIQLFRELQLISSDSLRQRVLQSIRNVLSPFEPVPESQNAELLENRPDTVTTTSNEANDYRDNDLSSTTHIDGKIVRFLLSKNDEVFTSDVLDTLISLILGNGSDSKQMQQSRTKLLDALSKYEGLRLCDVSNDIIENLAMLGSSNNEGDESTQLTSELSEASILQDVAGSLNLFNGNDPQIHQHNSCPYDMWPPHVHMDIEGSDLNDNSARSSQDGKVDLINCSEMHNGDLAEADQTCHQEMGNGNINSHEEGANCDGLPDVVDADEATPTEAEAEWLGLDRVPTRLHMESSEKRKD